VLHVNSSQGDLFEIFDATRDRRLGVRDFRSAAERLRRWDQDGDGELSLAELPHHFRLTFARGDMNLPGLPRFVQPGGQTGIVQSMGRGPKWFQKMDRNHDGDLSPAEFLGELDAFRKLDSDGDGLLDAREAAAAK
jgi:Ca2+-binding EF-hand superfamily protein